MCFANKNLSENELKCKRSLIKKTSHCISSLLSFIAEQVITTSKFTLLCDILFLDAIAVYQDQKIIQFNLIEPRHWQIKYIFV